MTLRRQEMELAEVRAWHDRVRCLFSLSRAEPAVNVEYFPDTNTLSITLRETPYQATGEDTGDPDVLPVLRRAAPAG